jgi:hypothetical protein
VAKTQRSTANSKVRSARRPSSTARQPVSSHKPIEDQEPTDPSAGQARPFRIAGQRREQHHVLTEPRPGREQGVERARGGAPVHPADGGDHPLPNPAAHASSPVHGTTYWPAR